MKIKRIIGSFAVLLLVFFAVGFIQINAATLEVSDEISVEGASVRTAGEKQGLRFSAIVGNYDVTDVAAYGIAVAYGDVVVSDNFYVNGTINEKAILNAEVTALDANGKFHVVIYGIPEVSYVQDVTARAYVKLNDGSYVYGSTVTVRNLAQVTLRAKSAGEDAELLNTVINYVNTNYKKVGWNGDGNYAITSGLKENDVLNLKKMFLQDYNKVVNSTLTEDSTAVQWFNDMKGSTGASLANAKIFTFFKDPTMNAKWSWLLTLLKAKDGTTWVTRQIVAIEGDGTNGDLTNLYQGNHFIYTVYNFFNKAHETGGYASIDFTNADRYNTLVDTNTLYVDLDNYDLVSIGEKINLPADKTPTAGYLWIGYKNNDLTYAGGSEITVGNEDAVFVPTFEADVPMDVIYVSSSASDSFEYGEAQLKFNVNLFTTISAALAVVESGKTVMVLPGSYSEDVTINKPITLTTPNASVNPTIASTAFTAEDTKVVMTGRIYINNGGAAISGINITGFTFTGAARVGFVSNSGALSKFVYKNNYAYDTNAPTVAYKYNSYGVGTSSTSTLNSTYPGFISLAGSYGWIKNATIVDSVFNNVSDVNVFIDCTEGATITGNIFKDCDRDCIRFEYGNNNGTINIKENTFENIVYSGIYLRSYCSGSALTMNVESNHFKNVATNATKQFTSTKIGCFATAGYGEKGNAIFNFKYNIFEDCGGYINIRANVTTSSTWPSKGYNYSADVSYNAFIQTTGTPSYFLNFLSNSDSATTNVAIATFNNNFYGTSSTAKVTPTASQYEHVLATDTSTFDTLAALREAVTALSKVLPNYNEG